MILWLAWLLHTQTLILTSLNMSLVICHSCTKRMCIMIHVWVLRRTHGKIIEKFHYPLNWIFTVNLFNFLLSNHLFLKFAIITRIDFALNINLLLYHLKIVPFFLLWAAPFDKCLVYTNVSTHSINVKKIRNQESFIHKLKHIFF